MKQTFTIGWLYPDLMSTYGDRGNVRCLMKRCEWRSISVAIVPITTDTNTKTLEQCDIILGGGAQDRQQAIAIDDLRIHKKDTLKRMFRNDIPGLFVCGSPQLLGEYYMTGDGKKLEGLGIFDFVTRHFGHDKPRCIGNTVGEVLHSSMWGNEGQKLIVGFENHGGRTYLGKDCTPFAKVLKGFGNNGEDGYEGALYKNVIACYYHGPFLPKNPHIADWLIKTALYVKYKKHITLAELDDTLEFQAHDAVLQKMNVSVE